MPFIGRQPLIGNYIKLDAITTSATATYNLTAGGVAVYPQTATNCIVSLNGVIQAPTDAYTISGSTIIFASALTTSDVIDFITVLGDVLNIGTPSDGTVGFSKVTSNLITGATAETSIAGGDSILIYDDSASALRKMTRTNFVSGIAGGVTNYFFAWDSDTGGVSGDIILDTTQINSGSNYSTTTGLYTAPSAGDYFFQVNFRRGGTGSADLYFEKNGSAVSSTYMQYSGTSNTTATFSVILTLASSDTIGWYSVNNISPNYCKFFGWRMS